MGLRCLSRRRHDIAAYLAHTVSRIGLLEPMGDSPDMFWHFGIMKPLARFVGDGLNPSTGVGRMLNYLITYGGGLLRGVG